MNGWYFSPLHDEFVNEMIRFKEYQATYFPDQSVTGSFLYNLTQIVLKFPPQEQVRFLDALYTTCIYTLGDNYWLPYLETSIASTLISLSRPGPDGRPQALVPPYILARMHERYSILGPAYGIITASEASLHLAKARELRYPDIYRRREQRKKFWSSTLRFYLRYKQYKISP